MFKLPKKPFHIAIVIALLLVVIGIILAVVLGGIWLATPYKASDKALALLRSDGNYTFVNDGNLNFLPKQALPQGVIVYPGGRVEAAAYSYICAEIANKGYPCIVAVMPFNLAVFKLNSAQEILAKYPEVTAWTMVGHSLGGSMAARYIKDNPAQIEGLILLGAYSDIDISQTQIQAIVISGSNDKVLNQESYIANLKNLPQNKIEVKIAGGNHAQFGDYGAQGGDGESSVSLTYQHEVVVEEILKSLAQGM